jgi:recombination protein RecT
MSNIERFENLKQVVKLIQPQFDELAKIHGAVNYVKEASFALQILTEKEFTANTAIGNQDSLKRAIINVAAIGLSLDPVKKLAYLVPRGKQICLDISYRGYVQLAVEVGAIKWAVAEVVREKDEYLYQGMGREPIHKFDPFGDRGEIRGAYCLAKTHDSEFILTQMNNDEILSIRDRSDSFKSGKSGPWQTDTTEMIKKTVIKRAAKSWPMIDTRSQARFEQAIDVTNDIDFSQNEAPAIESKSSKRHHQVDIIRAYLKTLKRTEEKYIPHLEIVNNREIKRIEDLTDIELNQAVIMLEDLVGKQKQKEAVNENAG